MEHAVRNHISVILGFCELLLRDLPDDDPRRIDLLEMRKAGQAALELVPDLSPRMRRS